LTAYIDTSVLVAYYCPEPLSTKAQEAITKARQPQISLLVDLELRSAFGVKVRAGELSHHAAGRAMNLFQKHMADNCYGIVPIDATHFQIARDWISTFASPLRAADALHLAAAFANELTLLTADKALAKSAERFGVRCELLG
jgi:uncharacterized protein